MLFRLLAVGPVRLAAAGFYFNVVHDGRRSTASTDEFDMAELRASMDCGLARLIRRGLPGAPADAAARQRLMRRIMAGNQLAVGRIAWATSRPLPAQGWLLRAYAASDEFRPVIASQVAGHAGVVAAALRADADRDVDGNVVADLDPRRSDSLRPGRRSRSQASRVWPRRP